MCRHVISSEIFPKGNGSKKLNLNLKSTMRFFFSFFQPKCFGWARRVILLGHFQSKYPVLTQQGLLCLYFSPRTEVTVPPLLWENLVLIRLIQKRLRWNCWKTSTQASFKRLMWVRYKDELVAIHSLVIIILIIKKITIVINSNYNSLRFIMSSSL